MSLSLIEEVKARLDIVAALEHFGVSVPARGGDPVMIRCPWHEDHDPSMAVYRHKGRAWCYGCNRGGDALDVTAHFLQGDLRDAVTYWRELLGLASPTTSREVRQRAQEARRRQEERHYRELAKLAARSAEWDLPRPRREEDIDLFDAVYRKKDAIDNGIDWVYDFATLTLFVQGLRQWREESLRLLSSHGVGEVESLQDTALYRGPSLTYALASFFEGVRPGPPGAGASRGRNPHHIPHHKYTIRLRRHGR